MIALLKRNTTAFEPTLLYIADHGESLGENGIYLHGLPYMIAPRTQTHVPLIVWGSAESDLDISSIKQRSNDAYSHDSIANALIGLFEIKTSEPMKSADDSILAFKPESTLPPPLP